MDVAHAASGRAGGFLALDWCDGQDTEQLARRSFLLHQTLAEELGQDIGYRRLTTLSLAVDSERPGPGEARAGPSWVTGRVRERRVLGTSSTTAQVHPRLLTRALMERSGARLVRDEMTGLSVRSGQFQHQHDEDDDDDDDDDYGQKWFLELPRTSSGS